MLQKMRDPNKGIIIVEKKSGLFQALYFCLNVLLPLYGAWHHNWIVIIASYLLLIFILIPSKRKLSK